MNTNNNNNFEQLLNNYLIQSEETLRQLNKRAAKRAGKAKLRCNKGSFKLNTEE